MRLLGELVKPSEALRRVLWHAIHPCRRVASLRTADRARDACGFVGCGAVCRPVEQGDERMSFRLQRVFEQCTRDAAFAAEAEASTRASSESLSPSPKRPRLVTPCARLVKLPEEILRKIVLMLHPADCASLSKASDELSSFLLPVVPGLKLRLFPHQVDALARMARMEQRGMEDTPMPLVHRLDMPGLPHVCVVADLVDGSLLRVARMPMVRAPKGGLFCDEPGLGKTITALSLVLKSLGQVPEPPDGRELEVASRNDCQGELRVYKEDVAGRFCSYGDDPSMAVQTRRARLFPYSELDRRRSSSRQVRLPDRHNPAEGLGSVPWIPDGESDVVLLSHASLIVVPAALTQHWLDQIALHVEPGRLRVLFVQRARDLPESAEELATAYDVILTSFNVIAELSNSMRAEAPLLMRVHFLRVIVDEGHKLSAGNVSQFAHACDRLRAERRWVMTGTPTPSTLRSDVDHLYQLLKFIREEAYGLDKKAWLVGIREPYSQYQVESLDRLRPLLSELMIRADKSILQSRCHISNVILDFTEQAAHDYNWLVSLTRRNLITSDWFSEVHKESLMNRKNMRQAQTVLKNLRYACCFGGTQDATFTESEVIEMLDILYEQYFEQAKVHKNDRFDDPTVEWPLLALQDIREEEVLQKQKNLKVRVDLWDDLRENGGEYLRLSRALKTPRDGKAFVSRIYSGILNDIAGSFLARNAHCARCHVSTSIPMITPCGHLLCDECIILDKTKCTARHCDMLYRLDEKGVPEELIELQPAAYSRDWKHDWDLNKSAKMTYLVEKIKSLPWNEEWFPGESQPRRTPPKVIVHSTITDHLQLTAMEMKKKSVGLQESYVEMFKNVRERDKELTRIKGASDFARRSVELFATDPNKYILLLSTRHGSVGLDLSFVQYIFLLEPVWDAAVELQVISRAHRIGSRRDIYVERLAMKGSVEHELLRELDCQAAANQSGIGMEKVQKDFSRVRSILRNLKPVSAPKTRKEGSRVSLLEKRKQSDGGVEVARRVRFRGA